LEVLESEDEALLESIVGPSFLARAWEVFDADQTPIAIIRGGLVLDVMGGLRARQVPLVEPRRQAFITTAREELAWFRTVQEGVELIFLPVVQDDPYAKMSLLAGAIVAGLVP
jgi:hypothetical protein